MKKYIITFILGLLFGVVLTYSLNRPGKSSGITTKNLSGEKISHSEFIYKGDRISFKTESEGKGAAITYIDKTMIPEAEKWLNLDQLIQANVYYQDYIFYGISYGRRCGRIQFSTGILFSDQSIGFQVGAGFLF